MDAQLEIRFHNVDRSEALVTEISRRAAKLDALGERIVSCRVTVDSPHKHHRQGNLYSVKVDIRMPGGEIVASREAGVDHAHEDAYVAVRDAFKAAQRQVRDYIRVQRGTRK